MCSSAKSRSGPDEEIGIWQVLGVEIPAESFVAAPRGILAPRGDLAGVRGGRVGDLGAGTVVEREHQMPVLEVRGGFHGAGEFLQHGGGQLRDAADRVESDLLPDEFLGLPMQEPFEQAHERVDLGGRSFPVFCGKGVQREIADAKLARYLDDAPHGLDTAPVAFDPR